MSDKQIISTVIDSIEERYDSKNGWGKYNAYIEGFDDVQLLNVPQELNSSYELLPGFGVTLHKVPFGWVVSDKSECFTGETPPQQAPPPQTTQTTQTAQPRKTPSRRPSPTKAPAPPKIVPTAPQQEQSSPMATVRPDAVHTPWNEYQIQVRDPQMRIQSVMTILQQQYKLAVDNNMDPEELINHLLEITFDIDDKIQGNLTN